MRQAPELNSILILFVGIFAFTGCVSPIVVKKPDVDLSVYHKVYFAQRDSDPREVFPRVLARLQKAGFDVMAVYRSDPPIGMQGSGFIISSGGDVLTCAHVVPNCTKATIWVE